MNHGPKRLTEGDSGRLGDMLRAARSDSLEEERVLRLRAGLAAGVAVASTGVATSAGSGAAGSGAGAAGASKWGGALLAKFVAASAGAKVGVVAIAIGAVGTGALFTTVHAVPTVPRHAEAPLAPRSMQNPAMLATVRPKSAESAPLAPLAPSKSSLPAQSASARAAPLRSPSERSRPESRSATGAPSVVEPPPVGEGALLLQARAVLETNPARAVELLHQHEVEFPSSQLGPERTKIAQEASLRLGH